MAQNTTQTITGTVINKASEKPLAGISVTIAGLTTGATTDSAGNYKLVNVPVGRQRISFSSVGYKAVSIPEILVTIGKQVILDVSLEESMHTLREVSVSAPRTRKGMALNEFAGSSARSFSMEEVRLVSFLIFYTGYNGNMKGNKAQRQKATSEKAFFDASVPCCLFSCSFARLFSTYFITFHRIIQYIQITRQHANKEGEMIRYVQSLFVFQRSI